MLAFFLSNGHYCQSSHAGTAEASLNITARDFTYGYWQNGMRKHRGSTSPDILCLETGYYALALDMAQLDKPRFGLIESVAGYEAELKAGGTKIKQLADADLQIEFELNGKTYRVKRCKAAAERAAEGRMQNARLWESARLAQHYDFNGLEFVDDAGELLVANAKLDLVAWPDSMTFNVEMEPIIKLGRQHPAGRRGERAGCL